ncbi:MAG: hypothetical protein QF561_01065 [Phycisphaerales bacterium]|nr:hypothetical protein [Phycisphaerales bacterium]
MRNRLTILLMAVVFVGTGCNRTWKPSVSSRPATEAIVVEHQTEGTHRTLRVDGPVWYQLTGSDLVVLDDLGRQISWLELARPGTAAAGNDMEIAGDSMAVLLGEEEVIVLDLADPWRPDVLERVDARTIGVWPESLAVLDDTFVAMGQGTARTLDGDVVARSEGGVITSVVDHDGRLLYVSDRRIHRRAGNAYLGTASLLKPATAHRYLPTGALLFARHERTGSLVGFLGPDCREIDAEVWTAGVPGRVHTLEQREGRVLAASDEGVFVFGMTPDGLARMWSWPRPGMEAADWIDEDRLAVAGSFGRGVVQIGAADPVATAAGWTPVPAGLVRAMSDGDAIIAESGDGFWSYRVGRDPERIPPPETPIEPPRTDAAVLGWSIDIDEDGTAILSSPSGQQHLQPPGDGRFRCVAATDEAFWLGHDHGILVVMFGSGDEDADRVDVRRLGVLIDGPVICIEPLMLGGGVAYAATHAGFGVVREVYQASSQAQRPGTR